MGALTRLRLLRLERGLTQLEVAQTTDVPAVYLSLYERKRLPFKDIHAQALAAFYGVQPSDLVAEETKKPCQ